MDLHAIIGIVNKLIILLLGIATVKTSLCIGIIIILLAIMALRSDMNFLRMFFNLQLKIKRFFDDK